MLEELKYPVHRGWEEAAFCRPKVDINARTYTEKEDTMITIPVDALC